MSDSNDKKVPAIVLGNGLTVLGVLRCLGRKGIPAYCISSQLGFERRSRWCRRVRPRLETFASASDLELALDSLPFERLFVIACSDHWTIEAARISAEFKDRFLTCLPESRVIERFVDKAGFAALLAFTGVPHPSTAFARSEGDVRDMAAKSRGELFLKPANSQRFHQKFGKKAFRIENVERAVEIYNMAREAGLEVLVQEYIPGPSDRHYFVDGFVDRAHGLHAVFARRRIRMFPPDFGNSSFMVSVGIGEVAGAVDGVRTLFEAARYRGIFSAEFKLDERDGQFKILEVNCRPWWYIQFAAECGVDVAEMAYRDALGLSLPVPEAYRAGVRLAYPYYDFPAVKRTAGSVFGLLSSVVRSWAFARFPIFAWDDPAPSAVSIGERVKGRIRRLFSAKSAV
jgi:D-aspartate ligase